jgi:hypothetical protein
VIEVRTFRKKPVEIEAVRFTGWDYGPEIADWCGGGYYRAQGQGEHTEITIPTLEGTMTAHVGDWIIKGVAGEFYPCKNSIFEATYEEVVTFEAERHFDGKGAGQDNPPPGGGEPARHGPHYQDGAQFDGTDA